MGLADALRVGAGNEASTSQEPSSPLQLPYDKSPSPNTMSKVVRSVKNVTKGYTTPQVKVRNGRQLQHLRAQPEKASLT